MSGLRISVSLEGGARRERAAPISGILTVHADLERRDVTLRVGSWFLVRGQSHPTDERLDEVEVFQGDLGQGSVHEFPFEVRGPSWPLSHHGEAVVLDWVVRATAESGGEDELTLDTPISVSVDEASGGYEVTCTLQGDPSKVGGALPVARLAVTSAILTVAIVFVMFATRANSTVAMVLAGVTCALTGFVVLSTLVAIASLRKIGNPQIQVDFDESKQALRCSVWVKPGVDVGNASARLIVAEEAAHYRSDGNRAEYVDSILYEAVRELERGSTGSTGSTKSTGKDHDGEFRAVIEMPPAGELPYSLQSRHASVAWLVRVDLDIGGIPDERIVKGLTVYPVGLEERLRVKYVNVPTGAR